MSTITTAAGLGSSSLSDLLSPVEQYVHGIVVQAECICSIYVAVKIAAVCLERQQTVSNIAKEKEDIVKDIIKQEGRRDSQKEKKGQASLPAGKKSRNAVEKGCWAL